MRPPRKRPRGRDNPLVLTFDGVPVIPRFDENDRRLRPYWAGVHGLVARIERAFGTEADLIEAIRNDHHDAVSVVVSRTAEGIEIEARRK